MTKNRRPLPLPSKPVRDALENVLSYLWDEEARSYAEAPRDDHIFPKLETVRAWLERNRELAPRFELGKVYMTPGAQAEIPHAETLIALARHVTADWGDCGEKDWRENDYSLGEALRLFSVYHSTAGNKFWVITEADRSSTTLLLPEEY